MAKEGVVARVHKHNANMQNQQAQYKEAMRLLNAELKVVKEKLEDLGRQKGELEEELTTLRAQMETAGADAVNNFKASDSFIDSCGGYYGTGFDDCLRQVASAFPELDLSSISLDDAPPMTPATGSVTVGADDLADSPHGGNGVVLAQPAVNLPPTTATPPVVLLDGEDPSVKK